MGWLELCVHISYFARKRELEFWKVRAEAQYLSQRMKNPHTGFLAIIENRRVPLPQSKNCF